MDSHASRCQVKAPQRALRPRRSQYPSISHPLALNPTSIDTISSPPFRTSPLPGYSNAKLAIKARGIGVKSVGVIACLAFTSVSNQKGTWYKYSQVYTFLCLPRVYKLIVAYPYLCCHSILTCGYVIICLIPRHFVSPVRLFKWLH